MLTTKNRCRDLETFFSLLNILFLDRFREFQQRFFGPSDVDECCRHGHRIRSFWCRSFSPDSHAQSGMHQQLWAFGEQQTTISTNWGKKRPFPYANKYNMLFFWNLGQLHNWYQRIFAEKKNVADVIEKHHVNCCKICVGHWVNSKLIVED